MGKNKVDEFLIELRALFSKHGIKIVAGRHYEEDSEGVIYDEYAVMYIERECDDGVVAKIPGYELSDEVLHQAGYGENEVRHDRKAMIYVLAECDRGMGEMVTGAYKTKEEAMKNKSNCESLFEIELVDKTQNIS